MHRAPRTTDLVLLPPELVEEGWPPVVTRFVRGFIIAIARPDDFARMMTQQPDRTIHQAFADCDDLMRFIDMPDELEVDFEICVDKVRRLVRSEMERRGLPVHVEDSGCTH